MVVGEALRRLRVGLLGHVIHLRPQARIAHRKIVLGAMTGTVGASASRLATSFEALDEGAAKDRFERRQLAKKKAAAFSQCGNGLFLYFHQTTCITGLIVNYVFSFVNLFFVG